MTRPLLPALFSFVVLHLAASFALACDWPAPNDLFTMAARAERISIIVATGAHTARVERTLKGAHAPHRSIRLGSSDCDPALQPNRRYVLFTTAGGQSISDSSAVELSPANSVRILDAVGRVMRAGTLDRELLIALANELRGDDFAEAGFRYVDDLRSALEIAHAEHDPRARAFMEQCARSDVERTAGATLPR